MSRSQCCNYRIHNSNLEQNPVGATSRHACNGGCCHIAVAVAFLGLFHAEAVIKLAVRVQVIAELDRSPFSELRRYTATDITPAFGPNLLQMVGNSKLEFKVRTLNLSSPSVILWRLAVCMHRELPALSLCQWLWHKCSKHAAVDQLSGVMGRRGT